MKAVIIKNKEGKYYWRYLLNPDILFKNGLKDCEIVEITTAEDLEQRIRKQVCNEIKEYIAKEYSVSVEDMSKSYHSLSWSVKEIYELLDQIEQRE